MLEDVISASPSCSSRAARRERRRGQVTAWYVFSRPPRRPTPLGRAAGAAELGYVEGQTSRSGPVGKGATSASRAWAEWSAQRRRSGWASTPGPCRQNGTARFQSSWLQFRPGERARCSWPARSNFTGLGHAHPEIVGTLGAAQGELAWHFPCGRPFESGQSEP